MIYKFKTKPYDHQVMAYNESKNEEFFALLMEMGTGKSKVIIDNFCYLFKEEKISQVLIVAPKGVYLNWMTNEIPIHIWDDVGYNIAWYSATPKAADKRALKEMMESSGEKLNIMLINTEALATKKGMSTAVEFLEKDFTMTIIDESTSIKNPKSKRTKACLSLGQLSTYRRILTGTPITQSPLDIFSQFEFLKKGSSGFTSYFAFKHYYAEHRTMTLGNRSFQKIVSYRNLDQLTQIIAPISIRTLKSECLDLPEKIYMTRNVDMTEQQKNMYQALKQESLLMLGDGLLTSTNALTTMIKLHQIACGHVKDYMGNVTDIPNNRVQAVRDIVDQMSQHSKAIIWCNFQRDVELVKAELNGKKALGGDPAVTYYGPDSTEQRESALTRFTLDSTCRFFIGTAQCGGKGLTLNQADYVIYYSNSFKLEDRLQSEDRCHRIGQDKNVTYIDISIPNTIDSKVLKALKEKKELSEVVLSNIQSFADFI